MIDPAFFKLDPVSQWEAGNVLGWKVGKLKHLLLTGAQAQAYERVVQWQDLNPNDPGPLVLHLHRAAGKSVLLFILALERALRHPGEMIRIGGPTKLECDGIFEPIVRMITAWRPSDISFEKAHGQYRVSNPKWGRDTFSTIDTFGCRELAESQRGFRANLIMLDEARNIDRLGYIIREVLGPQLGRKERPLIVLASTSPRTTAHEFWSFVDEAQRSQRYFKCGVTDNPDFSARDEQVLMRICGGKESISWRREALCARESDESLLALPSFMKNKGAIVQEFNQPKYFFPYIGADLGFVDASAILFAFVDYALQKLCIVDEIVVTGKGTVELSELIKSREDAHFGHTLHYDEIRRWADDTRRGLEDFALLGLHFAPARKGEKAWHKWRGLANLESAFHSGEILIHPRCKSLIYQCENAIRNEHQTDIEREPVRTDRDPDDPIMSHADAIWALAYLLWQTKWMFLSSPLPPAPYSQDRFIHSKKIRDTNIKQESGVGANVSFGQIRVVKGIQ